MDLKRVNTAAYGCDLTDPMTPSPYISSNVPFFLAQRWVRIDTALDRDTGIVSIIVDHVEVAKVAEDRADMARDIAVAVAERIGKMER